MSMSEYTAFAIKYPWHFTGPMAGQYPPEGCDCKYCAGEADPRDDYYEAAEEAAYATKGETDAF